MVAPMHAVDYAGLSTDPVNAGLTILETLTESLRNANTWDSWGCLFLHEHYTIGKWPKFLDPRRSVLYAVHSTIHSILGV